MPTMAVPAPGRSAARPENSRIEPPGCRFDKPNCTKWIGPQNLPDSMRSMASRGMVARGPDKGKPVRELSFEI